MSEQTEPGQLSYQSAGPENAQTIVFLHGGGVSSWMWQPVITRLPDYHCLAPDLPEHGESRAVGPFRMEFAADLTAHLIRSAAARQKAVVVGLSEGAQVALSLLSRHPEVVERAVISSALLRPIPASGWLTPGVLAWTYRLMMKPFRNHNGWIRLNMKHSAGLPDEYFAQFKKDFQETTESNFVNLMVANQTFRLPPGLDQAEAPTLIVAGKKEYAAMKQSAIDLRDALPCAKAYLLDLGRGSTLAAEHNWALTAPALFAQTVRAWIEGSALPKELEELSK